MLWNPPPELSRFYVRLRNLGQTERYRKAALAQKYAAGDQYENKQPWESDAPLQQRKPKIKIPLFAEAVREMESFVWGGENFPQVSIGATRKAGEAPNPRSIGPHLDAGEASALSTFLVALVDAARMQQCAREISREALVTTSAGVILYTQGGFLSWYARDGKDCTPTWSKKNPRRLEKLEIQYRYQKEEPSAWGSIPYQKQEFWYRRVVDEKSDTVMKEVPVKDGSLQPVWEPDPEKTVVHNLGFCPAHWVRTRPDSSDLVDGRPFIHPQLYPLLDDVNYAVSQRSRATSYGCEPQPVRTGVPAGMDRTNLDKAPGKIWDLPLQAELKFAEIQGSGAETATKHVDDLTERFRDAVGVVMAKPEMGTGEISGVVLRLLHRPMIALAGDYRHDFGVEGYAAILNIALRLIATETQAGKDIWIPGAAEATEKMIAAQKEGAWLDFPISIDWPPYFAMTEQEKSLVITNAIAARNAGAISNETMTRELARIFGVKDAAAESEKALQELADAQARAAALTTIAVTPTAPVPVPPAADAQNAADDAQAKKAALKQPPGLPGGGEGGGAPSEKPTKAGE